MPSENITVLAWKHAHDIVSLPEPPQSWLFKETDLTYAQLKLFKRNNLIAKADGSSQTPHAWVVEEHVYEHARDHIDNTPSFSCCGSTGGVSNVDGDLRCMDCGAEITTEEYREVM